MNDRVVVISGATGGLSRVAARAFAERGDSLALLSRDRNDLDSLARELNLPSDRILTCAVNLLDARALRDSAETVSAKFGAAHILLHLIGGWTGGKTLVETPHEDFDSMLDQHARTTINLFQAYVPYLIKAGWGRVMTVSVPGVTHPVARRGAYLMGKAAQEALFLALAEELKGAGVTSNIIVVNSIDVEYRGAGTTPDEIIAAMMYLCSNEAAKVNGTRLPLYK